MEGLTADTVLEAQGYQRGQMSGNWWYGAYVISTLSIMKRLGITADGEESATETGILAEAWD